MIIKSNSVRKTKCERNIQILNNVTFSVEKWIQMPCWLIWTTYWLANKWDYLFSCLMKRMCDSRYHLLFLTFLTARIHIHTQTNVQTKAYLLRHGDWLSHLEGHSKEHKNIILCALIWQIPKSVSFGNDAIVF